MRLEQPHFLLLLLLLPFAAFAWRRFRQRPAALPLPTLGFLAGLHRLGRSRWLWVPTALRFLVLALIVLALAQPQYGGREQPVRGQGIDIVLLLDLSGSMQAEDFTLASGARANRLEVAKEVLRDFIQRRPSDRFALVLFAARPYTQCPLTLDHRWLLQNLERANIGMIEDGTAIGSALATAGERLRQSDAKSKVVILLTDGQNNAGRVPPRTAAEALSTLGIKVYTVGTGTRGLAPFPLRDVFGNRVYRPIQVDIDDALLEEVAVKTGGRYFRATDRASLETVYREIDRLEKTEFSSPQWVDAEEAYPWFLLAAWMLFCVELFVRHRWLEAVPG